MLGTQASIGTRIGGDDRIVRQKLVQLVGNNVGLHGCARAGAMLAKDRAPVGDVFLRFFQKLSLILPL
jgi:hypothetical protein